MSRIWYRKFRNFIWCFRNAELFTYSGGDSH